MRTLLALLGLAACACVSQTETRTSPPILPASGSAADREVTVPAIAAREPAPPGAEGPVPRDGFTWWDDDGDGALTEDELTDSWVARLDRDGDGQVARAEWPAS